MLCTFVAACGECDGRRGINERCLRGTTGRASRQQPTSDVVTVAARPPRPGHGQQRTSRRLSAANIVHQPTISERSAPVNALPRRRLGYYSLSLIHI